MLSGRTTGENQLHRSESTFSHGEQKTMMADLAKIQQQFCMMPLQIILSAETILHSRDTKPLLGVENMAPVLLPSLPHEATKAILV